MPKINSIQNDKKYGLLSLFDQHNQELQQRVDAGEVTKSTLTKYKTIRKKVAAYIDQTFEKDDLSFNKVHSSFLNDLHYNLVIEQNFTHNTAVTYIEMLEKIFRLAIRYRLIEESHKPNYQYRKRAVSSSDYLTIKELFNLEDLHFKSDRLNNIYKLFLFSCYTGVTDTEIMHINTEDIVEEDSEEDLWLAAEGVEHWEIRYVPLFIEAEDIIDRFDKRRAEQGSELLFPVELGDISQEELNIIARKAGIQRCISFLTAVNTFYFSYSQYMNFPESSFERLIPHHEPIDPQMFIQYQLNKAKLN